MRQVGWFSQPYPPEGGSAADGLRKQLGRPELDLLTILVRESAQNSWDARLPSGTGPVDFAIDIRTVGPAHTAAWRDLLLVGAPVEAGSFPLRDVLRHGQIRLLVVSDRGTKGLGGPTRADAAVGPDRDFVSFVRNIGEPRDRSLGGGTYGFGKGIFYQVSRVGTVLVHSRCRTVHGHETRLIGCVLWKRYVAGRGEDGRPFTGRHWWGDMSGEVVEPLVGHEADDVARRLGLRAFGPDETGTTVVVVDPDLDELDPPDAADYLAETMAWHLWPKMLPRAGGPADMRFSVSCDGDRHAVPDPRETRPLNLFVSAYETMGGPDGSDLACHKPKRRLGRLGLVKRVMPALEPTHASRMLGVETVVHHVCLMRPAELVVAYHPGPKPPSENFGYAGVFRADPTMDETYAKAEPPTHDAWHPQSLDRPESTFVQTTFRRIAEALDGLLALGGVARSGSSDVPLGAAGTLFSGLVGGAWGTGGATAYTTSDGSHDGGPGTGPRGRDRTPAAADAPPDPGHSGSSGPGASPQGAARSAPSRRAARVQYVGEPYYDDRGDDAVLVQEFRLPEAGAQRVRVDLAVTLPGAGGRETDPPIGASMPTLIGWEDAAGMLTASETHVIEGGDRVWRVVVQPAADTVTEIGIVVEAVRPA